MQRNLEEDRKRGRERECLEMIWEKDNSEEIYHYFIVNGMN